MGIMSGTGGDEFKEFLKATEEEQLHATEEDDSWADEIAEALLEKAREGTMDQFPAYLTNTLKNDFAEDDYMLMSMLIEGSDPALRTLRHKYTDYYDWQEAMWIYEEQMEKLVRVYRSEEWVKVGLKEKFIPANLLPRKPKLKNSKENRKLIRFGAPVQRPDPPNFTQEQIRNLVDAYVPAPPIDEVDEDQFLITFDDMPKAQRKLIKRAYDRMIVGYRKAGIFRREGSHDSTIDAISTFMNSRTVYKYTANGEYRDDRALIDIVRDGEQWDFYQEEIIEDRIGAHTVTSVNGHIVDATEADAVELYQYLIEQGYGITIDNKSGLSKRAVRMLKRELGSSISGPLTAKEKKRLKKEQKKAQKQEARNRQKRYEADKMLSAALSNGETLFRGPDGETINLGARLAAWFDD